MSVWNERIARARQLAAAGSHGREMLHFYANLATYQSSLAIPAPAAGSDALDFADAVDVEAAAAAVPGLLHWLRRHGPAPLAQNALPAIDHVVHSHWRDVMRQRLVADDSDAPDDEALTGFVAEALLQPFAEAAAVPRREGLRRIAGARARCPVCGSRPSVAALREEGHGSKRTLVCGLCLTEWDYLRLVCPGCGEERFEALPVYTAEALPHARVDACDSCHAYAKTVDLTRDGTAVPLVDDLASLPLDLWARERGYHRLRPGLLRVSGRRHGARDHVHFLEGVMSRTFAAILGFVVGAGWFFTTTAQPARRYINPRSAADAANASQPPFSGAVLAGDTLYLSGMLGTGDTAEAAATAVLTGMRGTLEAAGMTMDDLVSVQVFCPDVADYGAFNTVYRTFFTREFPARAFLGSGPLLNNAKFEVQGIAVRR